MPKKERNLKERKPNIVFWDIETAPLIVTSWGLYPKSLSHESIIQDQFIICGCWKSSRSPKIHSTAIKTVADDYQVVKDLSKVIREADLLVHHNGDKFDLKKFNARLIYHKLPPVPFVPTIDTLKEVRKIAAFTSNRLDYLHKRLVGRGKLHTDPSLWRRVIDGEKKAVKEMVVYCKGDITCLEEFYTILRPYMKNHPHIGVMSNKDRLTSCPKCGGTHLTKNGTRITATGLRRLEVQCQDCGSYHRIPLKLV